MKRSVTIHLLSFIMGIITAYIFDVDVLSIFILFIIYIFILFIIKKYLKINLSIIYYLVFLLGIILFNMNSINTLENYLEKDLLFYGTIIDASYKGDYNNYIVKLDKIKNLDKVERVTEKVKLSTDKKFNFNDVIKFEGKLKSPKINKNPNLFNEKLYLKSNKIDAKVNVYDEKIEKVGLGIYKLKSRTLIYLENILEEFEVEDKAFLKGLILGKNDSLNNISKEKYSELGLMHILAISGLHIGIISMIIYKSLQMLNIDRFFINIIILLCLIYYSYLCNFSVSIMRACLMLYFYFLSIYFKRYYDSINILLILSFIFLLYNPFLLFNISFQLSFMATLGILLSKKINIKNIIISNIYFLLSLQIFLLPITIYYFNKVNIFSFLANLIIIPIITILLAMLIFYVFIYNIAYLKELILFIIKEILYSLKMITNILYKYSFSVKFKSPGLLFIIGFYILIFIKKGYFKKIRVEKFNKMLILFFLFTIFIIQISFPKEYINMNFIDVSQGDALHINHNYKNYLFDTGGSIFKGFDIGENITLPYLEKNGIDKLEGVFISHFDKDHSDGLNALLKEIEIKKVFVSYLNYDNPDCLKLVKNIKKQNIPIEILNEGDFLKFSNLKIEVLSPNKDISKGSYSDNEKSMVLKLKFKNHSFLLTGDINKNIEENLKKYNQKIDFLKVAHHGSNTSTGENFLKGFDFDKAIISVGEGNLYNHPSKEVISRLKDRNIKIYRTDKMGLINIYGNNNLVIDYYLKDKPKLYKYIFDNMIYMISYFIFFYISIIIGYRHGTEELGKIELYGLK